MMLVMVLVLIKAACGMVQRVRGWNLFVYSILLPLYKLASAACERGCMQRL
jgi:hypothetical protein